MWYWHKNRQIVQWNRVKSPEWIHTFFLLLIDIQQRCQELKMGKGCFFNKWVEEIVYSNSVGWNWTLHFKSYTNIKSKWSKGLNIKHKGIKLLEENMEKKLLDPGWAIVFGYASKCTDNKYKNRQIELHQTKKLLHRKGNNRVKR